MRKGESGLTILISVIIIMIILTQYLIFFVFLPNRNIITNKYQISESDLLLISFAELNFDLIVKSVKNDNYEDLEKIIQEIDIKKCFSIKIKEKMLSKCGINDKQTIRDILPETSEITIPDYSNNQIKITLFMENKK